MQWINLSCRIIYKLKMEKTEKMGEICDSNTIEERSAASLSNTEVEKNDVASVIK